MTQEQLYTLLEEKTYEYNRPEFIPDDPVSIPHRFSKKQDIEISGFFAAILAWGIRKTIINKCTELFELMDNSPYDFILNHSPREAVKLLNFRHRTFNSTDLGYFIEWFRRYYQKHDSLEDAFAMHMKKNDKDTEKGLTGFHRLFFSLPESPERTKKHIATPERGSACKRINMYLRWMVRQDNKGVDFGIWKKIKPSQLLCPVDLHVERVARKLGLIEDKNVNWKTTVALTEKLRLFDPEDPVKYDFALFGLGILEDYAAD